MMREHSLRLTLESVFFQCTSLESVTRLETVLQAEFASKEVSENLNSNRFH